MNIYSLNMYNRSNTVRNIIKTFKYYILSFSDSEFDSVEKMYMPNKKAIKKDEESMKNFIDFNKNENILYDNLYLGEFHIVIKTPMMKKGNSLRKIKVEYFSLMNDTFLTSY